MDIAAQKQTLLARREELTRNLARIEDELDDPAPKDIEDRSSERQGDEVLEALGQVELAELKRIDAALGRVEDGTYGECMKCGEPISEARLALVPDAALCKRCAR